MIDQLTMEEQKVLSSRCNKNFATDNRCFARPASSNADEKAKEKAAFRGFIKNFNSELDLNIKKRIAPVTSIIAAGQKFTDAKNRGIVDNNIKGYLQTTSKSN